jgi:four helix bundle protein
VALKEARECVFWLRLIIKTELTKDPEAHRLLQEAGELVGILNATVVSSGRPRRR